MKLKLTRRRMLITVVAVFGILVVWWSLSPRIDERLVGRWLAHNKRYVFVIRSDGSGMRIDSLDAAVAESPLTWRIRDGYLQFREPAPDFQARLGRLKFDVIEIVTGEFSGWWWQRRIVEVHQDGIVLEDPQYPNGIVLSRMPDDSPSTLD